MTGNSKVLRVVLPAIGLFLAVSSLAPATPHVVNGGFDESGDRSSWLSGWNHLYGWEAHGYTRCGVPSVMAMQGWRSVSPEADGDWMGVLSVDGCMDVALTQSIALDDWYGDLTLSFDYNLWALDLCDGDDEGKADQLRILAGDTLLTAISFYDDEDDGQCLWHNALPSVSGWTSVSLDLSGFIMDSVTISFEVENIGCGEGDGEGSQLFTAFVDNVRLGTVSEARIETVPDGGATLALLGAAFAALYLMGRRRQGAGQAIP